MNYQGAELYGEMNRADRMPRPLASKLPTLIAPAQGNSNMTPESLMDRLPSIVDRTPIVMEGEGQDVCGWINENPLLAIAGVVGLLWLSKALR